MIWGAILILTD